MNEQTQQGSTSIATTGSNVPTPAIITQRIKQAYNQASGPVATKDVLQRPWFRDNNLSGPTVGRAISALVRAHEIHKVREGVYQKGAGPQRATGTTAGSSTQARNGNGAIGSPSTSTRAQPKKAGPSQSQTKRLAAQRMQRANNTLAQQRTTRSTAKNPLAGSLGTTTQHMSGQTGQGAMIQRIQALEASNRMLSQQLDRVLNDMYGQQPR